MRLGLIRFKYDQAGGAERTLELLARGLMNKGHEVHVMCTRWDGVRPPGLNIHYVFVDKGMPPASQALDFGVAARVQMELLRPDMYLSLDRVPGSPLIRAGDGCHAAWLGRRAPYESALKRLSFKFRRFHRTLLDLEKRTFEAPELIKVMANSRMVAAEIQALYGLGPEKLEVVYNGVEVDRRLLAKRPEVRGKVREKLDIFRDQPVLLFLGSGFERKGLAFAIRALAHLPQAVLLVAGRDRIGRYQFLASRLKVEQRVRFLGRRSDGPELLAAADALLLPTIYDPCSNACLEALVHGVPVVTTTGNGASELVDEGISGYVVDEPADSEALAHACQKALALRRPFPHRVPAMDDWLEKTVSLMEKAAASAVSRRRS